MNADHMTLSPSDIARFWAKVAPDAGPGCWLWRACKDKDGYGFFRHCYKNLKSHRVAYTIAYGAIPDGFLVLHSCDNPSCVKPTHLFIGDNGANQIDAARKGRHAGQKLTVEMVKAIRGRHARGETQASLCREYGLSGGGMCHLIHRRRWRHVH